MTTKKTPQKDIRTYTLAVIIGLLLIVSAVQAVELNSLKGELKQLNTELEDVSVAGATATAGGGANLAQSIQNLPQMVGGC